MSKESEKEWFGQRVKNTVLVVGGTFGVLTAGILIANTLFKKEEQKPPQPNNSSTEKITTPPSRPDFNKDGIQDKVEIREVTSDLKALVVKLSQSSSFQEIPIDFIIKADKIKVEAEDFDNDGKDDIRLTFNIKDPNIKCNAIITKIFMGEDNGKFSPFILTDVWQKCEGQQKPGFDKKPDTVIPGPNQET